MGFVIWGAGVRGERLLDLIGKESVVAFIDTNKSLTCESYCDKPVISFSRYIQKYKDEIILVSPDWEHTIVQQMQEQDWNQYLLLGDFTGFDIIYDINYRYKVKGYIEKKIGLSKVAIYGISIYSILVYDWLSKLGNSVYIIKEKNCKRNSQAVAGLLRNQGYKVVENQEELPQDVTILLNAAGETEKVESKLTVIDITDFGEIFPEFETPELRQFKKIHQGRRCFIVATGPSLQMKDLDRLRQNGEICIGVNKIFYAFDETDWRPDYYVVSDKRISKACKNEILAFEAGAKFINACDKEFWKDCREKNIYKYHHYRNDAGHNLFSDDITRGIRSAATVLFIVIQIAAYMGFSEMYLLGVDHTIGKEVNAPERHFYGNKDTKAFKMQMFPEDLIYLERDYRTLEKYSREHGFRIYNATRGGKLEIFERRNFDELFTDKREDED